MKRKTKDASLCEWSGCKARATIVAHKLWGKGGTLRCCDEHRPGSKSSDIARKMIEARGCPFYRLEPIAGEAT